VVNRPRLSRTRFAATSDVTIRWVGTAAEISAAPFLGVIDCVMWKSPVVEAFRAATRSTVSTEATAEYET
jgi:hypothetical protein